MAGTALADGYITRLVIVGVVHAYAAWRTVMAALRLLVAPGVARIRLVRVSEAGAAYLVRWTRRIAAVAVFGYAIAEIGLLFGLYYIAYEGLLKLVALAATICLVIVVLQTHVPVAERMRPPPERTGWMARLRSRAAIGVARPRDLLPAGAMGRVGAGRAQRLLAPAVAGGLGHRGGDGGARSSPSWPTARWTRRSGWRRRPRSATPNWPHGSPATIRPCAR